MKEEGYRLTIKSPLCRARTFLLVSALRTSSVIARNLSQQANDPERQEEEEESWNERQDGLYNRWVKDGSAGLMIPSGDGTFLQVRPHAAAGDKLFHGNMRRILSFRRQNQNPKWQLLGVLLLVRTLRGGQVQVCPFPPGGRGLIWPFSVSETSNLRRPVKPDQTLADALIGRRRR